MSVGRPRGSAFVSGGITTGVRSHSQNWWKAGALVRKKLRFALSIFTAESNVALAMVMDCSARTTTARAPGASDAQPKQSSDGKASASKSAALPPKGGGGLAESLAEWLKCDHASEVMSSAAEMTSGVLSRVAVSCRPCAASRPATTFKSERMTEASWSEFIFVLVLVAVFGDENFEQRFDAGQACGVLARIEEQVADAWEQDEFKDFSEGHLFRCFRIQPAPPRAKNATPATASKTIGFFKNDRNEFPSRLFALASGAASGSVASWLPKMLQVEVFKGWPFFTWVSAALTWVSSPVRAAAATASAPGMP